MVYFMKTSRLKDSCQAYNTVLSRGLAQYLIQLNYPRVEHELDSRNTRVSTTQLEMDTSAII